MQLNCFFDTWEIRRDSLYRNVVNWSEGSWQMVGFDIKPDSFCNQNCKQELQDFWVLKIKNFSVSVEDFELDFEHVA